MKNTVSILIADDDEEDRMLAKEAFDECRLLNDIDYVSDGVELLEFLKDPENSKPGLILLDLNMPKKDGREALKEIKDDPELKHIPIIVLTTSKAEEDIIKTYDLGVNSFISKPVTFDSMVNIMKAIQKYWFEIVELPISK